MRLHALLIAIFFCLLSGNALPSPEFVEAIRSGDIGSVKAMIEAGEDVNQRDGPFDSPVIFYTQGFKENLPMLKVLVDAGADINARDNDDTQLILKSAMFGSPAYIEYLISKGADVNSMDKDQGFPLNLASSTGKTEAARALIKGGADVNKVTGGLTFGYSPLISATVAGKADLVQLLLDSGADKSYRSQDGTALELAKAMNKTEIVKILEGQK